MKKCIVIGLGSIGMRYDLLTLDDTIIQTHTRAIELHPEFELIGAVDPAAELQHFFEYKFKKPAFATVQSALQQLCPDIVVISCPTVYHCSVIKEVINYSKPCLILCEKPLSYSLDEAEEIVKICEQAGIKLIVNYIRRSDVGVIEIKRRIADREIKGPFKGVCYYSKGFLHNGSHFFNLFQFWLGDILNHKILNNGPNLGPNDSEPDLFVSFDYGDIIFLSTWNESFAHHNIELVSQSGKLNYQFGGSLITWQASNIDTVTSINEIEIIPNEIFRYQWNVLDNIAKMLTGKESFSLCNDKEAFQTLKQMNSIINN
jgi:predicted dehydrogenase